MKNLAILLIAIAFTACASVSKYAPSPTWEQKSATLGPVKADSGKWPLALRTPPSEYTFQSALLDAAAKQYQVPRDQIVLSEISVKFMAELDGTIRSWEATAEAGKK
jgi:hypothetical protein